MFTKIVFNSRLNITKISNIENAVATHVVIVFRTVTVKNFTADSKSATKCMHSDWEKNCYCMLSLFNHSIFSNCVFIEYAAIPYLYSIRIAEIVISREEVYLYPLVDRYHSMWKHVVLKWFSIIRHGSSYSD